MGVSFIHSSSSLTSVNCNGSVPRSGRCGAIAEGTLLRNSEQVGALGIWAPSGRDCKWGCLVGNGCSGSETPGICLHPITPC